MDTRIDRRRLLLAGSAAAVMLPSSAAVAGARQTTGKPSTTLHYPIRLSANENPYGPGPAARAAIAAVTEDASRYAFAQVAKLTDAIAGKEQLTKEGIVISSGSGELLHMLALTYCERGQLTSAWPTFGQIHAFAEKLGCEVRRVPLDGDMKHDLPALAKAVSANTSLLYLCNPNNPTGTVVEAAALRAFCEQMAQNTLVVVDEAYLDLVDGGATASMVDLVRSGANVVVLRTFSKIHGLAGMRVGYALARPDVAARLRRLQLTFPNIIGVTAAEASLGDTEFLRTTRAALLADRQRICAVCDELGLKYANPQGNFVFIRVGMPTEDFRKKMLDSQIQVGRAFEPYNDYCRVTIGTTAETAVFLDALRRIIKS